LPAQSFMVLGPWRLMIIFFCPMTQTNLRGLGAVGPCYIASAWIA
jgi:hypothetical protein